VERSCGADLHCGPAMGDEEAAKHLCALGSQMAKDGDYGGAYAQFSEALQNASSVELKSAILISRSYALGALSRWAEALADAEECRKIRPSWSRAFEYKSAALNGLGRAAEAEVCKRLATALASLKMDPKSEVSDFGFPPRLSLRCPSRGLPIRCAFRCRCCRFASACTVIHVCISLVLGGNRALVPRGWQVQSARLTTLAAAAGAQEGCARNPSRTFRL